MAKSEQHGGKTGRSAMAMAEADRERFHTFLKIAADSPFSGERDNALEAARRLASRHGLSLHEAAQSPDLIAEPPPPPPREKTRSYSAREMADIVNLSEARLNADKERYEQALRDAIERGLDGAPNQFGARSNGLYNTARSNGRKRDSQSFAHVLLSETSMPLTEIVSLTGLDIYKVVGMKLKLRPMA